MIRMVATTWAAGALWLAAAAPSSDLLRFSNGDQLHGHFQGITEGPVAVWQRDDVMAPVEFKTSALRHIVLRGGKPERQLDSLSYVELVNGDRIPGTITGMDGETVMLETRYAGALRIPRDQVTMLAPSPLGGRLHYHGPFDETDWKMTSATFPDGVPATKPAEDGPKDESGEATADEDSDRWVFSGSAWYWPGKGSGTALIREGVMPDRSILRFDIAWKSRLSVAVGFHADFVKPKPPEPDKEKDGGRPRQIGLAAGDSSLFPIVFGNSYVLQIFSTHLMLFRTSVDEDGVANVERVQINGNTMRLGDAGKATIEIRSNRVTGVISLFINDEFVVQWSEGGAVLGDRIHYAGKGEGLGFVVQTEESAVRIDDIMVAEWNGMPDSARSLQVDDQDIVLLANGTDRFSGKVAEMQDGKLVLDGKYGQFQFQLEDIAEVRFARNGLAKPSEPGDDNVRVRFSPLGLISGRPLVGTNTEIRLLHPVCGEIEVNLESAVMLEFEPSTHISDDWEMDF